ncbi:MAG: hypothetical protein H0T83_04160 [Chthoniobacterales bacterium]|nr:hypothetical protein [Chthoniobacterales bacterium]
MFLFAPNAHGDLIFADSFDYLKGDLAGNGPPPGSPPGQVVWQTFNLAPQVASFGLEFGGILSLGKSAALLGLPSTNGDKAVAALGPVTANDGTVWVAFLIRKALAPRSPGGYAVVSLGNNVTPSVGIGMLFQKDRYGLDNNTGAQGARVRTAVAPSRETVWLVTKLDFENGKEFLWVNPSPALEPEIVDAYENSMTAAFMAAGFSEIVLVIGYTEATFQFDELRVGTTFADVVNPEVADRLTPR